MESDVPPYQRDPAAWWAYLAEGNARQARKRVSADVIVRDQRGWVLLVDPTYKPDWDIPGGMAEANEAPHEAARRELLEELGLEIAVSRLMCIDWVSPHGPWDDLIAFVFDGGELGQSDTARLVINDGELREFGFFPIDYARQVLGPSVRRRLDGALNALATGHVGYLRDGHPL